MPDTLKEQKLYQVLFRSEEIQLEKLKNQVKEAYQNQFINSANARGIRRYETLLNIPHIEDDDLELRRNRILIRWNQQPPYTLRVVKRQLELMCGGKDNFDFIIDYDKLEIQLVLQETVWDITKEVMQFLEDATPLQFELLCNYLWNLILQVKILNKTKIYLSFNPLHAEKIRRINGTNLLNGVYLLTGCKSKKRMDNYPLQVTTMQTAKQKIRYKTFYYYQCNNTKLQTNILAKTIIYSWFNPLQDYLLQIMNMHIIKQEVKIPVKLTVWRKWGQLDGKNQLNGTRTLAAEKFEYKE